MQTQERRDVAKGDLSGVEELEERGEVGLKLIDFWEEFFVFGQFGLGPGQVHSQLNDFLSVS